MEENRLRLIRERQGGSGSAATRALGLLILVAAALATASGADRAREAEDPRKLAEEAMTLALSRGSDDPEVRSSLAALRRTLGNRPLDSRTRVVYSSLVLGLAVSMDDMRLAAFHARRAAEISPVTVSIVWPATLVVAQSGDTEGAVELIRAMFGYEPEKAAALLAQLESFVLGPPLVSAIPETPEAWMTWSRKLRDEGRGAESEEWAEATWQRWPDHAPALEQFAEILVSRQDWGYLSRLFPAEGELPRRPVSATLWVQRAQLKAAREDAEGARYDATTAATLDQTSAWIQLRAGDVYERIGDVDAARHAWNRALYLLDETDPQARRGTILRLARLEDRHGRPAVALRWWNELLALEPQHAEGRRRADDLSGFRR